MKPPSVGPCPYGAPMGRHSDEISGKVHCARVQMTDGGAYDSGGAYWGIGTPLYCAWNDEGYAYVRAPNRTEAKRKFEKQYKVTFYR